MRNLLIYLSLLLAVTTNAQGEFTDQNKAYTKWLESRKLSQFFEVYHAEFNQDVFTLFLEFKETPPNKELWEELQKQHINDLLYKSMLLIYGQEPINSDVQI